MDLIARPRYTGIHSLADTVLDTIFGEPLRRFQRQMRRFLNRARLTASRLNRATLRRARERAREDAELYERFLGGNRRWLDQMTYGDLVRAYKRDRDT